MPTREITNPVYSLEGINRVYDQQTHWCLRKGANADKYTEPVQRV